jgi:hypothetical protein
MAAQRNRPHLPIGDLAEVTGFKPWRGGGPKWPAIADPAAHGKRLLAQLDEAHRLAARRPPSHVLAQIQRHGFHVAVRGFPTHALALEALDSRRPGGIKVCTAVEAVAADGQKEPRAVLFVPFGQVNKLRRRLANYASGVLTDKGKLQQARLAESIASFDLAILEQLWTDSDPFPSPDATVWWEVWLRADELAEPSSNAPQTEPPAAERFRLAARVAGVSVRERALVFGDRAVLAARATPAQLAALFSSLDDLAELRGLREPAGFFRCLPAAEQSGWVEDLLARVSGPGADAPAVCVLDTGVNRGHLLLAPWLAEEDAHACRPEWGTADRRVQPHGTEMAGLALWGDLNEPLASAGPVELGHRLESVKVLPPRAQGDDGPELWGTLTSDAAALVEIAAPHRRRCFSMAISAPGDYGGEPTSWSAAVDALAWGGSVTVHRGGLEYLGGSRQRRLFVIAAGNVRPPRAYMPFPSTQDGSVAEDPAQAWNALSVGASTELALVGESEVRGLRPLAPAGELSPYSRTGAGFGRSWPNKPDILMEGGNVGLGVGGEVHDGLPDLSLLTTSPDPATNPLEVTWATSAACSLASRLCARLQALRPEYWPETIRALVVHSARWSPRMRENLKAAGSHRGRRAAILRRYGFGIASYERAAWSATNALTLVSQATIHPFANGKHREMHFYQLPWPREALRDLGDAIVRLRIVLSYFVQPNPGRRGWSTRFRYASHGLRFALIGPPEQEGPEEFRRRINKHAAEDEVGEKPKAPHDPDWIFGPETRERGSLHCDIWEGPATALAERSLLAVYPVAGWWKELPKRDRSADGAPYALVVSIESEATAVDLWTPVANQVGIGVAVG